MRNYNIDILRSLIMLFIVIWHSILHGIAISKSIDLAKLSPIEFCNYNIIQLLAYLTSISVNCFVMISGYFSINKKSVNYDRIITIWLQTFFYSLTIYILLTAIGIIPFKITSIIKSILPIITNQYWFINNYIPLMLIGPYISKIIIGNSQKENIIILLILSFFILTFFSIKNLNFPLGNMNTLGYNLIWFIYLYIVGGYIRLYEPLKNKTKSLFFFFITLLILLTIKATFSHVMTNENTFFSINYNGITFILSFLFFIIVKNIKFNTQHISNKLLIRITPYIFGVYLIHDNSYIRAFLWYRGFFQFEKHFNTYYFIGYIIAISITIFTVCVFIDKLRSQLFKILQVNKWIAYIRFKISYIFNYFYYKFIENK